MDVDFQEAHTKLDEIETQLDSGEYASAQRGVKKFIDIMYGMEDAIRQMIQKGKY